MVGCIRDAQEEYRDLVNNFMEWCGKNYLLLNVAKTKEMVVVVVVDYRRKRTKTSTITIMGQDIELVDTYLAGTLVFISTTSWTGRSIQRLCTGKG